jgi:hypothetical protein
MPTLAELYMGQVEKLNTAPLSDAGWETGAKLAQMKQQREMQNQELQAKKQELESAKYEKLYAYMGNAKNYSNAADRKAYLKSAIGYRNAMNLSPDVVSDDGIMSLAPDENFGRAATIGAMVDSGEMKHKDALDLMTNPMKRDAFSQIIPTPPELINKSPDLSESQNELLKRQSTERAAAARIQESVRKQTTDIATTGSQQVAKKTADEFTNFQAVGGAAAMVRAEQAINSAINELESGKVKTGGWKEKLPYGSNSDVIARTNPQLKALLDKVLSSQNIKALTGDPNPTQQQIEGIYSRILDGRLDNKANIDKMKTELAKIRNDRANKTKMFIQQGFMAAPKIEFNFKGRPFTREGLQKFVEENPKDPLAAEAEQLLKKGP